MIKRIVKMSFVPEKVNDFKNIFKINWKYIKGFEGCEHVELLQDKFKPNVFFTFSLWKSEDHLNAYRNSELFESVWGETKVLFNEKPQAWSLNELKFD
ncbi:putative quinol monooxygenase [Aurantibacillus circumpalustris]|uniref:putative quinol monooxygenase n=1 Tax=Aurantibacillus circumpalustris TaxID=3036359 RepID=UPI00295A8B33|nr:antibiotic biosynthesis monooxygenase family protein [Aurantibacillus circumpalustris]